MAYRTHIARAIRDARKDAGVTRDALAERLGVSTGMVRNWERHDGTGDSDGKGISPMRAGDVAHALGLPRHWFDQAFALERQADLPAAETTKPVIGLMAFAASFDRDSWVALWERARQNPEACRLATLRSQMEPAE